MIELGLSEAGWGAYLQALHTSHRIRASLVLLDRDEKVIDALTGPDKMTWLLRGQVQVETAGDTSRSLSIEILDPTNGLRFEANSPADGAIYSDRFIAATYDVYVDALERWVPVPVFYGPVTRFERNGAVCTVEARGKESLMLEPHFATAGYTVRKRTKIGDGIRQVAGKVGEHRYALPTLDRRLRASRPVQPESEPWKVLRGGEVNTKQKAIPGLVERIEGDYGVYYDGRGYLTVRSKQRNVVHVFDTARDVIAVPALTYEDADFKNTIVVRGGKPKNRKPARAKVPLPASHPRSPHALARNGKPRYMTEFVDADGLKTDKACRRRGQQLLARASAEGVGVSFQCLPIPHLEEDDQVRLVTPTYSIAFPIRSLQIPLTAGEAMVVGTRKPVPR